MTPLEKLRNKAREAVAKAAAALNHNITDAVKERYIDDALGALAHYIITFATEQTAENAKQKHDLQPIASKTAPKTPTPPAA